MEAQIDNGSIEDKLIYKRVFDYSNDAIFIINLEYKFVKVNRKASEILNSEFKDIIGKKFYEVISPENKDEDLVLLEKLIEVGSIPIFERKILKKDGRKVHCRVNAAMIFDKNNKPKYFQGIVTDLSEKEEMSKIIEESEEKYKKLFQLSSDAIFLHKINSDGTSDNFIDVNDSACRNLGYSRDELLQKSVRDISISLGELDTNPKSIKEVLLNNPRARIEAVHITKKGKLLEVDVTTQLFKYKGENVLLSIARDISVMKKMERERNDLEKRRKDFIATTSHELRTPVASIKGYIEILRDYGETIKSNKKEQFFKTIDKQFIRLERLINDVSSISKLDRGVLNLKKEIINFTEFIENDIVIFYESLLNDEFEYEKKFSKEEIFVFIDKDRIFQAISNIIDNAIKHTPENDRKIKVSISLSSSNVHINITDNGAGIEEEDKDKVFDQFYSKESQYSIGGTGIGLYLSRTLLNLHNGNIEVFSEGKNKGSTFELTIPIDKRSN